jgi:hypothetical protein
MRPPVLAVLAITLAMASVMAPAAARADDGPVSTPSTAASDAPQAGTSEPAVPADPSASSTPQEPTTAPEAPATPTTAAPATPTDAATTTADAADPADPQPGETVVGQLVQAYDEPGPGEAAHLTTAADEPLSWIETGSGESVRVSTDDVDHLSVGTTVAVTVGGEIADEASAEGLDPAVGVLAAETVAPATNDRQTTAQTVASVNHQVTVVMTQPAGVARGTTTLAQVQAAVNGPVADFWAQQTGGAVRVGSVGGVDWFQSSKQCSDPYGLWAEAATQANWSYAPGQHLLVFVPTGAPGCAYGLGEVRQNINSGGRLYVQATATSVITHELGHNLGLNHSSQLQCASTVEATSSSACSVSSYRDYYDVMGYSWDQLGTLNVLQAAQLGVLPPAQRIDVTAGTAAATYALAPVSGSSGTRALRLAAPDGSVYWLEYRPSNGKDNWLSTSDNWVGIQPGVLLRRESPGASDSSLLLDPSPSATTAWSKDYAHTLQVGVPATVGGGAFTLVLQGTGATATVTVRRAADGFNPPAQANVLAAGEGLADGGQLASSTGGHVLVAQGDGNLVLYRRNGEPIWNTGTAGTPSFLVMQGDGNLVLYARSGVPLWNSGTNGNPGASAVMQDDGNLVVYRADGRPVWWTGVDVVPVAPVGPSDLPPGVLAPGQSLVSPRGRYQLIVQGDGNVVLYAWDGRVLWHAGTNGHPGAWVAMQGDGNLVVYSAAGQPLWNAQTNGNPGARGVLQDDGNLVVYRSDWSPAWWTNPDPQR